MKNKTFIYIFLLSIPAAQAQQITIEDGLTGHVLSNNTYDSIIVRNPGTKATINNIIVNNSLTVNNEAQTIITNTNITDSLIVNNRAQATISNTTVNNLLNVNNGAQATISGATVNNSLRINGGAIANINDTTIKTILDISGGAKVTAEQINTDKLYVYGHTNVTSVSGNGFNIFNTNANSVGIQTTGSAKINLTNVHIDTISYGIDANGSVLNNRVINETSLDQFTITSKAKGVQALFGSKLNLTNGSITTTGTSNSHGISIGSANEQDPNNIINSKLDMKNVTINTIGDASHGLHSTQTTSSTTGMLLSGISFLDQSHIITKGNNSYGAFAAGTGNIITFTNQSSVITHGNVSHGLVSLGGVVAIDNGEIYTYGNNAYGTIAQTGKLTVDNSHIYTSGTGSAGIYAVRFGNGYVQNNSKITTTGINAHGAIVSEAGQLYLSNSSIQTEGNQAHGLYAVDGIGANNNKLYGSKVEFKNSNITSNQGYGILAKSGYVVVDVLENSTLKGGLGLMGVEGYTSDSQGNTTVILSAKDSSTLLGAIDTDKAAISNISLEGNSTWEIDRSSTITNLINDNSTIRFIDNNNLSALNIRGNYVGNNGSLIFNTALNDDLSESNKIIIGGNVSGHSTVIINNRNGIGNPTKEGILLIEIMGVSPSNAFTLKSDYIASNGKPTIIAGAYGYSLYHGGVDTPNDGNWYLRSYFGDYYDKMFISVSEGTYLDISGMDLGDIEIDVGGDEVIDIGNNDNDDIQIDVGTSEIVLHSSDNDSTFLYQPGVPLYESYANVLYALNDIPSLKGRIGDRTIIGSASNDGIKSSHYEVWSRIQTTHEHISPHQTVSRATQKIDTWQVQLGIDVLAYSGDSGHLVLGVNTHYGHGKAHITSGHGNGKIETHSYGIGSTLTWYGDNGFYADAQVKTNWFDTDIRSYTLAVKETSNNKAFGYALGLETGYNFGLNNNWSLTPQVQLIYSNVDYDNFYDATYALVSQKKKGKTTGRVGLSIDYDNKTDKNDGLRAYGIVNLYQNFTRTSEVNVANVTFSQRRERTWVGVGAGATYSWGNGQYTVYGNTDVKTSTHKFGKSYSAGVAMGLRIQI